MSKLSVCIEDVNASKPNERYVRCVAVPGRQPGLRVDASGRLLWRTDDGAVCELWVSADERLVLWRCEGGGEVVVTRSGRSLSVPEAKPVMLINGDEFEVGGRRLKIHLHGIAPREAPPEPVIAERNHPLFRTAATAVIVGASLVASVAGAAEPGPVEVREHPPAPPLPPPDASPDPGDEAEEGQFAEPPDEAELVAVEEETDASVPVEIREQPPAPPPPEPAGGCCSKQPGMASGWRRDKI